MTEENNAKKDVNDTIDSMLNQLKKTMVKAKKYHTSWYYRD